MHKKHIKASHVNVCSNFVVFIFCCLFCFFVGIHGIALPRHRNADDIAPLPDAVVTLAVDGFVFPQRALAGGGHRRGVGVIRHGVNGQKHKTGAAIHKNFHGVHALLGPAHGDLSGIERGGEDGFEVRQVHGLVGPHNLQCLADGIRIAGRDFDAGHQRRGAAKNVGCCFRRGNAQAGRGGRGPEAGTGTVAGGVLVSRPLLRIRGDLPDRIQAVSKKRGVSGHRSRVGGGESQRGGIAGQLGGEVVQPRAFAGVIRREVVGFGHDQLLVEG